VSALLRPPVGLHVGIEARASAHHWTRKLQALGHTVRRMASPFIKPYVKRNKNDAADAEAICEAVARPSMYFAEAPPLMAQFDEALARHLAVLCTLGRVHPVVFCEMLFGTPNSKGTSSARR
jgi:transposase